MFAARDLQIQLALNGSTFDGSSNILTLRGLRSWATIQATTGGATPFFSQAQVRIDGMLGSDMAQLSTLGLTAGFYVPNTIQVAALSTYPDGTMTSSIAFSGMIYQGIVDYNSQPDTGIILKCSSTFASQLPATAPSSYRGSVAVASMLQAICAQVTPPLKFVNNGVSAVLSNHAVSGSPFDQIVDICLASLTNWSIVNGTLYVWPQGSTVDDKVITLSPATGMKGYPQYTAQGIAVEMEYNPDVLMGRQMTIESSIPPPGPNAPVSLGAAQPIGASGTFWVGGVTHELSANVYNGPWFTKADLTVVNTQLRAS